MIDHLSTYTTKYDTTRAFYLAALGVLGYGLQREMVTEWDPDWPTRRCAAFGPEGKPVLWVIEVREAASPRHVAFLAANHAAVDAFHEAALANGGSDHGAPGPRPIYHEHYYGAFAIDPDGNNVEAVCHQPQ
jgi:catechol 2,3-dioxygenase-like lactoylglutathione lyase family enzyme